jgi:hypothetical protein
MMRPVIVSTLIELARVLVSWEQIRSVGHLRKPELGLSVRTGA